MRIVVRCPPNSNLCPKPRFGCGAAEALTQTATLRRAFAGVEVLAQLPMRLQCGKRAAFAVSNHGVGIWALTSGDGALSRLLISMLVIT